MRRTHAVTLEPPAASAEGSLSSCLGTVTFTLFFLGLTIGLIAALSGAGSLPLSSGECRVSSNFPPSVLRWCGLITQHAEENNLDPNLVAALIWHESGGNAKAYSKNGAVGLMQVMPRDGLAESFQCKGEPCFADRPSIRELEDPAFNIQYGTRMLSDLAGKHRGNLRDALKAYGPIGMEYRYADTILGVFHSYRD